MNINSRLGRIIPAAVVAALALTACSSAPAGDEDENIQVVFIGESSSTDVIWTYRADRMREEAQRLGVEFVDRYAEGDLSRQAQMIEEEVARGVDAIIAPFFDPMVANNAVQAALDEGVAVYALLGAPDMPSESMAQIAQALTDWGDVGAKLAEVSLDVVPDGGIVAWPAEAPDGTYITDAVAEYVAAFEAAGKSVDVQVLDATGDPTTAASTILSYLTGNDDVDAVVTSGAIAISAANTAMTQGGRDAGDPPLFGQVVNPASSLGILKGYMLAGVNLELTESSYEAIRVAVDIARGGDVPAPVAVPLDIITTENIEEKVPAELRQ